MKYFFIFYFVFIYLELLPSGSKNQIQKLDYKNAQIIRLRNDIKQNLKISLSNSSSTEIRKLTFYTYRAKKNDNFFKIMTFTSLNIDTLVSVNNLSSIHDIKLGKEIIIPNMRGIYAEGISEYSTSKLQEIAIQYSIDPKIVQYDPNKKKWFLPGKNLNPIERQYFFGMAFLDPLGSKGQVSSNFGKRVDPFTKKRTFHGGIDLKAPTGTPVYAAADGKISLAQVAGGYGKLVVIDHILGYETWYGHLTQFLKKEGEHVKKGDLIGRVGETGRATGPHLHFEVRKFDKRQKPRFFRHS